MRCWQLQGFNEVAQKVLGEKVKVGVKTSTIIYEDGREPSGVTLTEDVLEHPYTTEKYKFHNPWYYEGCDLLIYRFKDGRVLESYVQAEPWSGGPCTFLALRDHVTKEPLAGTLWDEKLIDRV